MSGRSARGLNADFRFRSQLKRSAHNLYTVPYSALGGGIQFMTSAQSGRLGYKLEGNGPKDERAAIIVL